jgi:hypothetical protein
MSSILAAVKDLVVSGVNGVDLDATMSKVRAALAAEIESAAVMDQKIEAALDNVYDLLKTDKFPTPSVVAMAASSLVGSDLTQLAKVSDQIHDYLNRSVRFKGERGRNGGLKRLSK